MYWASQDVVNDYAAAVSWQVEKKDTSRGVSEGVCSRVTEVVSRGVWSNVFRTIVRVQKWPSWVDEQCRR